MGFDRKIRNALDIWNGWSKRENIRDNLTVMFGLDYRSMALFRVFVAISVIGDVMNRWDDIRAHYSDVGIMPRQLVLQHFSNDQWITPHMMGGTIFFIQVISLIHIAAALMMLVGWYTRSATALTWFLTISLHNRNLLVLHGGDIYQRVILFFAMFLPIGARWSIDSSAYYSKKFLSMKHSSNGSTSNGYSNGSISNGGHSHNSQTTSFLHASSRKIQENYYLSVACFAIAVQISLVYVTSYIHKTGKEWRVDLTATWLALQLEYFVTPVGEFMLTFGELLKPMTAAVLWWEGFGPLFWYSPILTGPLRTFGALGFSFMHIGFASALRLGQFGCIGTSSPLILLPSWFWDNIIFRRLRTRERLGFKLQYNSASPTAKFLGIVLQSFFLLSDTRISPMEGPSSHKSASSDTDDHVPSHNYKESDDESVVVSPGMGVPRERSDRWTYQEENDVVVDIKPSKTFASQSVSRGPLTWRTHVTSFVASDFEGNSYKNFDAVVAAFRVSPLLYPLAFLFRRVHRFRSWGQTFLDICHFLEGAEEKSRVFSEKYHRTTYATSSKNELRKILRKSVGITISIMQNLFALFFLWFILSWCAGNLGYSSVTTPHNYKWIGYVLHLDQSWAMFSPRPPSVHWSYIIQAELDNGTEGELWRNEGIHRWEITTPLTWEKPDPFWRSFKNHRWFKYFENGLNTHAQNEVLRLNFGRYICREYNMRHRGGEMLYKFSIHWLSERVDPKFPGQRFANGKQTLWNHICYDKKK